MLSSTGLQDRHILNVYVADKFALALGSNCPESARCPEPRLIVACQQSSRLQPGASAN